jgi:chorismate lyase
VTRAREEDDEEEEEETNGSGDKSSYETVSNPLSYAASEREAMDRNSSLLFARLSPAWRVLLLSDGSVTRHLSLLGKVVEEEEEEEEEDSTERRRSSDENKEEENNSGNNNNSESTRVEVISMKPCGRDSSQPEDVVKIKGPLVQREVYLRYADAKKREKEEDYPPPLVYACSWWNANALEKFMKKREETMWSNLRKQNVELYREVRRVYLGKNRRLAKAFGLEDLDEEIWARHYIFWSGGEPVTVVFEAFSPKIELV